ncbi:transcription factor bHLH162-like [Cynara cardunculus var. scolymus]|uniref:Myc-type, basic helix-loop-helix (BHLH) domain-containing protein n=1 Tax=Cynara cardunculus var. scolymus TaxID=59895 RepID=A0A103XS34_CYNCS|nr:transcription factor bHLH162-like [Cynara cardunculus var. scolymus]KVH95867.1 Myc-type, basic helix-loop-helix (bHLH) domain-containing protein [Cynara cardunculus var. scolymus]
MERKNKCSGSGSGSGSLKMKKPERKITEKNRRNNMNFLYSHLFSLIPPHLISKGGAQVSDRVDRAIDYIQTLKDSLEMNKKKKEQLLSKKRSFQHTKTNIVRQSLDVQIQEMSPDLDAVLVTGLKNHSDFCDVVQLLERYSTEVALANFSSSGHSIFHLRHKKMEADEMSKRIKNLIEGSSKMKELELELELGNDDIDINGSSSSSSNISKWDFDIQSTLWEWELEMLPMNMLS